MRQKGEIADAKVLPIELEVTEQTKRAYFEIYYVQRAITITQENRKVLEQIAQFASIRYEMKKEVSQQDVLRAQTELANLDAELVRFRQDLVSNRARRARLLHVSPNTNLQVDFQQLQSNFQEVLRIQLMLERQRSQLQQTISSLERAVGGDLNATPARSERQN